MSISASEARKTLYPLIERVNADHDAVEIVSRKGRAGRRLRTCSDHLRTHDAFLMRMTGLVRARRRCMTSTRRTDASRMGPVCLGGL